MQENLYQLFEDLSTTITKNKKNFLKQGELLYWLRKNSSYREAIGDGGVDSWHDFLAQPEIGMSPTQANKLLNIYELFIKKLKYAEEEIIKIPIKTLNYLVKSKEDFEKLDKGKQDEIVSQAQVLNYKDFKEAYFDQKNESNKGQIIRTYTYVLMQKCDQTGNLSKVHAVDSSELELFVRNMTQNDRPQ